MFVLDLTGIYGYFLALLRVGSAIAFMPGMGEGFITARVKAMLVLTLAFVVYQVVESSLPAFPQEPALLTLLIIKEVFIGLFIGLVGRFILGFLEIAGSIISFEMTLSNATIFNPSMRTQGSITGGLLVFSATVLIFVTDMHHMIIHALIDTYRIMPVSHDIILEDFSSSMAQLMQQTFVLAVQVSIPFLIIGTVFQVSLGLFNRLMPQIQIFFVGMPLQTLGGLFLLFITIGAILMRFLENFDEFYTSTLGLR